MSKKIIKRLLTFAVAICMAIGSFTTVPAYAAGEEQFPYAGAEFYVGKIPDFSSNMTQFKTAPSDPRTHRMIFRCEFKRGSSDEGLGEVKLNVYIKREGSSNLELITTGNLGRTTSSKYYAVSFQTDWFTVSPNERFQIYFDVVSANPAVSNGSLRYGTVEYWVYSD